jgi:ElaB/YqjD/DUF883 family membrane-anchored ribosome-binding protein
MKKFLLGLVFVSISLFAESEKGFFDMVKDSAVKGWEKTKEVTTEVVDDVKNSEFVEKSSEVVQDGWEATKDTTEDIVDKVSDSDVVDDAKDTASDTVDDIADGASSLWKKTKGFVSDTYEDLTKE